jgi:hypothetical protein
MAWFGTNWGAHCCEDEHVLTPVNKLCIWCDEPISVGDRGFVDIGGYAVHLECRIRMVVGSTGHQLRKCSCYGGTEEDQPGLTRRESALKAMELFERNQKNQV